MATVYQEFIAGFCEGSPEGMPIGIMPSRLTVNPYCNVTQTLPAQLNTSGITVIANGPTVLSFAVFDGGTLSALNLTGMSLKFTISPYAGAPNIYTGISGGDIYWVAQASGTAQLFIPFNAFASVAGLFDTESVVAAVWVVDAAGIIWPAWQQQITLKMGV